MTYSPFNRMVSNMQRLTVRKVFILQEQPTGTPYISLSKEYASRLFGWRKGDRIEQIIDLQNQTITLRKCDGGRPNFENPPAKVEEVEG